MVLRGTRTCGPLLAVLTLAACESSSPLARLEPFAGDWRCPMNHLTAGDAGAARVMQELTIARERGTSRYEVRFSPDPTDPSPEAVTSVAYWSYDSANRRFVSQANVGDGQTAAEEHYESPGPQAGSLVWTGEIRALISAPMRMTFTRTPSGLDLVVEAFTARAWKPLSTASCTKFAAPVAPRHAAISSRPVPALAGEPGVERGAPLSAFVDSPADRFAYKAIEATEQEQRDADDVADKAQAEVDRAIELSQGTIDKSEAGRRIQQAYADRDSALDRIFGEERAEVLRRIHLVEGVEVPDDSDPD